jgi:hypothetical protein
VSERTPDALKTSEKQERKSSSRADGLQQRSSELMTAAVLEAQIDGQLHVERSVPREQRIEFVCLAWSCELLAPLLSEPKAR